MRVPHALALTREVGEPKVVNIDSCEVRGRTFWPLQNRSKWVNSERPVNSGRTHILALTVWSLVDAIGALGALSPQNG